MNKNETLLKKFIDYNAAKRMAGAKKRCLLTVSGGIDSIVLCDLFYAAKYPFTIAHCNFGLRGAESDGDEQLVKALGKKYKVEVFVKKFETRKYAEQQGVSTQMAARDLRYEWFEQLRAEHKLAGIATAHHLNDNIETIIFNLTKGTGIKGLRGIPVRQGKIIRPLLFASRHEIEAYQKEHGLTFREDSSNADDKYTRNKIRHQVIPLLKEINPSLETTLGAKIDLLTSLEELYEKEVKRASRQLFIPRKADIYIPIAKLRTTKNAANVLYEYLKQHNFNGEHVEDMLANLNDTPGKQYITDKARVIKDRKFFILTSLAEKDNSVQTINETDTELKLGDKSLKLQTLKAADTKITSDKSIAFIDKSKLKFPLVIRRWREGDYFYPFGMKLKKKKLKKFFTDEKLPLNEKENIWIVESDKKIVWAAGYRMDERFKVSENTSEVFKMVLK